MMSRNKRVLAFEFQRMLALCMLFAIIKPAVSLAQLTNLTAIRNAPATQKMVEQIGQWQFTPARSASQRQTGRFIVYTPPTWDGITKLPMLIFLHGAGARTEREDTIEALYKEFFPTLIRQGKTFDAIVLCPQVSGYWGDEGAQFIDQAIDFYKNQFDHDRLYLTGLSSGGGGTWRAAVLKHDLLAAAVPICGIRTSTEHDDQLVNLPIWAFHNKHDPYQKVQYTRDHIHAIGKAGGQYIRYTEYDQTPGKSHTGKDGQPVFPKCHPHAWEAAYSDDTLWQWLFAQQRGQPQRALTQHD